MDRREGLRSFLVQTPFFGGLDERALDAVVAMLRERRFAAGEVIYRQGEQGKAMYIVESGSIVMCCAGEHGHEVKLNRFGRGDFFGDTTLIAMEPRPSTARVEKDAMLLELTNMDLYKLYKSDVHAYVMILQNMNRELCRRIRKTESRITQLADEAEDDQTQIKPLPTR